MRTSGDEQCGTHTRVQQKRVGEIWFGHNPVKRNHRSTVLSTVIIFGLASHDLPLQKSWVHHVYGQKSVVQRAERRGVETDGRFLIHGRRSVVHDRFDHGFFIGRRHCCDMRVEYQTKSTANCFRCCNDRFLMNAK